MAREDRARAAASQVRAEAMALQDRAGAMAHAAPVHPLAHEEPARAIAHDLSNLLTAIIGATDALLDRHCLDRDAQAEIAHIREGARRGAALVTRLRGDLRARNDDLFINATIDGTSRLLAHCLGPGIVLTLQLAAPDIRIRADEAVLDRVLLNLIANARHAMKSGGKVTLSTEPRTLPIAQDSVPDRIPAGRYVVVGVADTGIGIPPGLLRRIFEPGFTTRERMGGTGQGLPSVHELVRLSGGYLSVESVEGLGTRFDVFLPVAGGEYAVSPVPDPPPPVAPAAPEPRTGEPPRTVLLVEDDPFVAGVAERMLGRAGWTVLRADSAEDAIGALIASGCELMISDVAMPGMDGLALTRAALAMLPDLPVILTSGYERFASASTFGNANVEFLAKPYGQKDLLAAVARASERRIALSSTGLPAKP
jgi:two-component system cell cycle sensor histidine kinase/response regulator CckA